MKKKPTLKFTLLAIFASIFLVISAQAATLTVNSTNDPGNGTCDQAECTLREAIAAVNATPDDDVIEFDAAVFNVSQTITLTSGVQLTFNNNSGALTINGTGADQLTISGNNTTTVFRNNNLTANVVINAVTITRGRGGFGGGIANSGPSGNLTLNNSIISFNTATNTGGGFNTDGTLTLNNSTLSNNSATVSGGGISNGGTVILNNSTVSGNTATNGGGISNGTFNNGSRVTLNSTTLSNNSNSLRNNGTTSITTLNNSIIANSTSGSDCTTVSGTINATYSLIEDGTCGVMNGVNNNKTGDPNLGLLADNGGSTFTHALLPGSIAIDAGNSALMTDQRGMMRPIDDPDSPNGTGNLADIGSFEVLGSSAAGVSISGRVSNGRRGIAQAIVHITDQGGNISTARTNQFGYYRFTDVAVGQSLVVNVFHKQYQFNPQVVSVSDNIADLDFTADGFEWRTR